MGRCILCCRHQRRNVSGQRLGDAAAYVTEGVPTQLLRFYKGAGRSGGSLYGREDGGRYRGIFVARVMPRGRLGLSVIVARGTLKNKTSVEHVPRGSSVVVRPGASVVVSVWVR